MKVYGLHENNDFIPSSNGDGRVQSALFVAVPTSGNDVIRAISINLLRCCFWDLGVYFLLFLLGYLLMGRR